MYHFCVVIGCLYVSVLCNKQFCILAAGQIDTAQELNIFTAFQSAVDIVEGYNLSS